MAQQLTTETETAAALGGADGVCFARGGAPWTGRDMWLGGAIALGGVAVGFAPALFADDLGFSPPFALFLAAIAAGGAMLLAARFAGLARHRLSWRAVGWRLPADARRWWMALAALIGSVSFTACYALIAEALGASFLIPETLPADMTGEGWTALALGFAVIVWTPLAEETFFRGFIFAGLAAKWGIWGGIAASSAIFAAAHGSAGAFIPIAVSGALFAWVYRQSGSLWLPVSAHASQNLLAFAAAALAH